MKKTLGIDLGSNSLGWAILDDITLDVVDKGVVVFPEGLDPDAGSSLETPAAARRAARMGRRMKFRRKLRKWHLLSLLIDAGMCPLTHDELDGWKKSGIYPVSNKAFIDWLKSTDSSNPYCDRAAAAEGEVPFLMLGRALYHLAQRRGFKSSRKEEAAQVDDETGEVRKPDKETGKVKGEIAALTGEIAAAGCKTLGQYFHMCMDKQKNAIEKRRIRCRYTDRVQHYMHEFNVIMDAQKLEARPDENGKTLRDRLFDAIFMQRPLRSQKHLVGNCPLEPHNPRAQLGHPAVEEFTLRAFVNNLSLEDEDGNYKDEEGNPLYPLTPADREAIFAAVASVGKPSFKTIRKAFKKDPRFAIQKLRFHYYDEDDAVPSCPTRTRIAQGFGTIAYDDADNGMPFLMTLPVSRGSYVRAKYLFILLTGLAAWVLGLALMFLMAALRGIRPDVPQELVSAAGVLPALLVMMDLLVPLQLKYGPEKSRLALIVIFGLVAAVSFALSGSREEALAGLLEAIGRIPAALLLGAGFAAAALLTVLSLVISTRVMNKKEF